MKHTYTLHFDPSGDLLDAGRDCEAEVFLAWFGNTRAQLAEEYGPYDDASVFIVLADGAGDALGACRLIVPGGIGLKTLDDLAGAPWWVDPHRSARAAGLDPARTWDIATLGVRRGLKAQGLLAAAALYHGLILASRVNPFDSIVSVMDDSVRDLLVGIGMITHVLPGARSASYLGSPASTPLYGHNAAMLDGQRRLNPDAYRLIAEGIGLDGVDVPEPDHFRLRRRVGRAAAGEVLVEPAGSVVDLRAVPQRS